MTNLSDTQKGGLFMASVTIVVVGSGLWIWYGDAWVDPSGALLSRLESEEGFRSHAYTDTRGVLTIGYGTSLKFGITHREASALLKERLDVTYARVKSELPWIVAKSEATQSATLDMAYQLGVSGLLEFHKMLTHLRLGQCKDAKREALDSAWARETPNRARRVVAHLCAGE